MNNTQNKYQKRKFMSVFVAASLAGCNVHPLPKDVSTTDTFSIVKNIRCEAKFQVIKSINGILQNSPSAEVRQYKARNILEEGTLEKIHKEFKEHKEEYKDKQGTKQKYLDIAKTIQNYTDSAISYNFRFEITEDNNSYGEADLRFPFTNGTANFSSGASLNAVRLGKREFKMVENFSDLEALQCGLDEAEEFNAFLPDDTNYLEEHVPKERLIYPLSGSVDMAEIMESFLRLGILGGGDGNFTDTITFTTTKSGNVSARVAVNPGPLDSLRIANAAVTTSASREDIHEVIITLAFPKEKEFETAVENKLAAKTAREKLDANTALEKIAKGARLEAAIAQCIQRAEAREDRFNVLRDIPPEVYCFDFARNIVNLNGG